jgi:GH43 family beta-xylosidase
MKSSMRKETAPAARLFELGHAPKGSIETIFRFTSIRCPRRKRASRIFPQWLIVVTISVLSAAGAGQDSRHPQSAISHLRLHNPLLPVGPDPWVEFKDGSYYYMNTTGTNLTLWKTPSMADLAFAPKTVVWRPPSSGPYSHDIWAPEIHFIAGRWYIYFAADAGTNQSHRIFVLENSNPDPLERSWLMKGKVADRSDKWAIDASVFEDQQRWYMIWSGWEGDENGTQSIYIARLSNPWTVEGQRTRISTPQYPWEKVGDVDPKVLPGNPPHIDVNEGPEILKHEGKPFSFIQRVPAGQTIIHWEC